MLGHEVYLANDADCLAVSEARDGAAAGAATAFAVILGTDVGGGIVIGGRLLRDPMPSPASGVITRCPGSGRNGMSFQGPSVGADTMAASRPGCPARVLCAITSALLTAELLSGEAIVQRAEAGEERAAATLSRYEDRLARALAHVINLLDPDVIVLGGGVSRVERLYRTVPALWESVGVLGSG